MASMPRITSAGIECSPANISHQASHFHIVLSPRETDRKGVFAAIAPDGGMSIVYISYGIDTDPEDLLLPSRAIAWESARNRNRFEVDAKQFDALASGTDKPRLLFRQAGVYQFALLNSHDRELLQVNREPFRVKAGCVVNWQP
jgi:hypothetical protein